MFHWIKKSSPAGLGDPAASGSSRKLFGSLSRISSIEDSLDTAADLEDPFIVRKSAVSFGEQRRKLSKKISSVFRGRSRLATLEDQRKKSQSTSSLLRDAPEIIYEEDETLEDLPKGAIAETIAKPRKKSLKRMLRADGRRKLFKRKPLEEYAKGSVQDLKSESCSSSSMASCVSEFGEDSGYITSSSPTKGESSGQSGEAGQLRGKLGLLVSRARTVFLDAFERRVPQDSHKPSEDGRKSPEDPSEDESASASLLRDSGIYEDASTSIPSDSDVRVESVAHHDFIRQQPRLCTSELDTRRCGCESDADSSGGRGSSNFRRSTSCVEYNHTSTPLKNAPHMMRVVCGPDRETDRDAIDRALGIINPALDICWNSTFLNHGFTGDEDFWNEKRPYMSKSAVELMRKDEEDFEAEIPEFNSLYDLSCRVHLVQEPTMDSAIRMPFWEDTFREESVDGDIEDQVVTMPFGYEEDSGREESLASSDGSYVITMYV